MATISSDDILFVTIMQRGATRLSLRITGMDSFGDIVGRMRAIDPALSGMATIDVRNTSRGWSSRRALVLG